MKSKFGDTGGRLQSSLETLRRLMLEHQSMVFSIARRIVHDPSLAEEVAQDVFFELYGNLASLTSEEHVLHWLRRVAVHRAIDQQRRSSRPPHAVSDSIDEDGIPELSTSPQSTDPWLADRLRRLVATLPLAPRTAIVLRYQEDLSPDEIASLLGMPVATVKSHLQRALKVLRAKAKGLR